MRDLMMTKKDKKNL